jgi:hypothetical protein
MSFLTGPRRYGQTLVQVAMLMMVFFAFMAIAIDVGHIFNERRRMQNAADAGALAGAWEICFGDPALAEVTAREYATDRNHAQVADVSVAGGTVTVYAREATDLYVARILGIPTADINAVAVAACGPANRLCGIWPISFHLNRWIELGDDCYDPGPPGSTGVPFYVFNDRRFEEDDDCYYRDSYGNCHTICEACICNKIPPDDEAYVVGPGHRGWLLFPQPSPPFPDELSCAGNCGSNQVRCWIDSGSYSGEVEIPQTGEEFCLPGQPGVAENVRIEIKRDHIGETPNVLIWNDECAEGDPVTGECPGTPYNIVDTGCIIILGVTEIDLVRRDEFRPPDLCESNVKVIKAMKYCDCSSECGSTGGGGPGLPGQVRAVSLIE